MADDNQNNNTNNQNKGGQQQKSLPFYMVKPDGSSNVEFVKDNNDGTYNICVLVGLVNPNDRTTHVVVRFVNGKQIDGIVKLTNADDNYVFESVSPNSKGEIELGFAKVSDANISNGVRVVIPKTILAGNPLKKPDKNPITVEVNYPDPQWVHVVVIKLFDDDGNATTGSVRINARQQFEIDGTPYTGSHTLTVTDAAGITVNVKALQHNEGFMFTDLRSNQVRTEVLLGVK